jgi:hypothetical protein
MADRRIARLGRWHLFPGWRPLLVVVVVTALGIGACAPYGDGAADMYRHRKKMRATSEQYERGTALAGQALVDTLSGRTLVYRHRASPGGYPTDTVIYRYFRPDGRFVYVDSSAAFLNLESSVNGDYWKVNGPQLCVKRQQWTAQEECYLVARTDDGTIQFYVDDPGGPYHDLLTTFTREIINGPPPSLH